MSDPRDKRVDYLQKMGIGVWVARVPPPFGPASEDRKLLSSVTTAGSEQDSPGTVPEPMDAAPEVPPEPMGWDALEARVASCTACSLHRGRTQTVFGVGGRDADWLFIGEAPGEQEDLQGKPFVGRAGQLLDEMIRSIGLSREAVFIANVLKCRPPRNRDPLPEEAAACEGFLKAQIRLVNPKIIVAVGRIAAQNLLKTTIPIGKLRGRVHDLGGIPLIVTYHPAYLLRSQTEKRRAWEDLKLAMRTLHSPGAG